MTSRQINFFIVHSGNSTGVGLKSVVIQGPSSKIGKGSSIRAVALSKQFTHGGIKTLLSLFFHSFLVQPFLERPVEFEYLIAIAQTPSLSLRVGEGILVVKKTGKFIGTG